MEAALPGSPPPSTPPAPGCLRWWLRLPSEGSCRAREWTLRTSRACSRCVAPPPRRGPCRPSSQPCRKLPAGDGPGPRRSDAAAGGGLQCDDGLRRGGAGRRLSLALYNHARRGGGANHGRRGGLPERQSNGPSAKLDSGVGAAVRARARRCHGRRQPLARRARRARVATAGGASDGALPEPSRSLCLQASTSTAGGASRVARRATGTSTEARTWSSWEVVTPPLRRRVASSARGGTARDSRPPVPSPPVCIRRCSSRAPPAP